MKDAGASLNTRQQLAVNMRQILLQRFYCIEITAAIMPYRKVTDDVIKFI